MQEKKIKLELTESQYKKFMSFLANSTINIPFKELEEWSKITEALMKPIE